MEQWSQFLHDPMSWFALFTLGLLALVGLAVIRLSRDVTGLTEELRAERHSNDLARHSNEMLRYSNQHLVDWFARTHGIHVSLDPLPFTDEDPTYI